MKRKRHGPEQIITKLCSGHQRRRRRERSGRAGVCRHPGWKLTDRAAGSARPEARADAAPSARESRSVPFGPMGRSQGERSFRPAGGVQSVDGTGVGPFS